MTVTHIPRMFSTSGLDERPERVPEGVCAGQAGWGGWGSNPRPADYESAALTG